MSRRKRKPDYMLAKAVDDTIFRAGMSAFAIHKTRPEAAEALMRTCDQLEANYTSECGEHYAVTLQRGP